MFENIEHFFFFFFASLMVMSALFVVLQVNILNSALFLVLFFLSLAGMFGLMHSIFLATLQILVYAGAIMVLIVFVIMLVPEKNKSFSDLFKNPIRKTIIVSIFISFICIFVYHLYSFSFENISNFSTNNIELYEYTIKGETQKKITGNTSVVGAFMFLEYLLPFELISFLLVAAIIGVVVISQKKSNQNHVK